MEETIDFSKICRACLSSSGPMKDMFSDSTLDVFRYCTSVEIFDGDKLPKMICQPCLELLNKLLQFKQEAVRSHEILKQYSSSVAVKGEIVQPQVPIDREVDEAPDNYDLGDTILKSKRKTVASKEKCKQKSKLRKALLKCSVCAKGFIKYENLEAHMRKHFGKKARHQLQRLQQNVQEHGVTTQPRAGALRSAALPVPRVRQEVRLPECTEEPRAHPRRSTPPRVPHVQR